MIQIILVQKIFCEILYKYKIKSKFYKANSGYIFEQKNGVISTRSKISKNNNPYIQSQIKAYNEVKKFREKEKVHMYNFFTS